MSVTWPLGGWRRRWLRDSVRRGIQTTPLLSAELRRKIGHTALGREDSIASLLLDNFYGPFSKDQRARLHIGAGRRCLSELLALFRRAPECVAPVADAVRRSKNISGGAAHEAGSDEHGGFASKAASRSSTTL